MSAAPIHLGPGPEKPPLAPWAEGGLHAIFNASTKVQFDEAFDAIFAQHAEITKNGQRVSREQYKERLYKAVAGEASANVVFDKSVSVPADPQNPAAAGTVGLFFTANVTKPSPKSNGTNKLETVVTVSVSLNLVIIQDESVIPPNGNTFAARRVSVLNEVASSSSSTLLPLPGARA